jgi:hypothetical protein
VNGCADLELGRVMVGDVNHWKPVALLDKEYIYIYS